MSLRFRSEQLRSPLSGTFTGSFIGDGSQLTNLNINTGSFATTGSNTFTGAQNVQSSVTASNISLKSGNTDASTPYNHQIKLNYYGGDYPHYIVTEHSISEASNSIDFWVNKGYSVANPYDYTTQLALRVTGNGIMVSKSLQVTGPVTANNFTGSLYGTSSWAENVISSSYSQTASYALNASGVNTSSLVTTSSFNNYTGSNLSQFAGTASFALTASSAPLYVLTSVTSSMRVASASFATTASYLSGYVSPFPYTGSAIISGSLTVTGSTNINGANGTTLFSSNADTLVMTGSFLLSGSMSVVGTITGTASLATSSSFATTASYSVFAVSASYIDGGFY